MGKNRLPAEIEIDGFLAEIIGSKDALLILINEKFQVGCSIRNPILLDEMTAKNTKAEKVLYDLSNLVKAKTSWFWLLNELRNHSMHRKMLNKRAAVKVGTDNSKEYFLNPSDDKAMDIEIIPYLEQSLQNMTNLIENTRNKDPLLK